MKQADQLEANKREILAGAQKRKAEKAANDGMLNQIHCPRTRVYDNVLMAFVDNL
jgi:hypothetical protein